MFPDQDPINRHVFWTDPVLKTTRERAGRRISRIIGVAADIDDQHLVPEPTLAIYSNFERAPLFRGRLFIHTGADPIHWLRRSPNYSRDERRTAH